MSSRVLNFSRLDRRRLNSLSARPCGSWIRVMAGKRGSSTLFSPRSFRRATRIFFLATSTALRRFAVFFECWWIVTPPVRRSSGFPEVEIPAASASSRSSSSSSSAMMRSIPRKKLCAVMNTFGLACSSALATMLTVLASVHTRRRYRSMLMSSPFFAATSPPSARPLRIPSTSACALRFRPSFRFRLLAWRRSVATWSFSSLRSALSGTLKSRKHSWISSKPSICPRLRSSTRVCTMERRSSPSSSAPWRSSSAASWRGSSWASEG
mmetsp:Transcript_4666/g.18630  ORF Transcript_4666/g.18630 Transcript_4666/m.18630 type:complete len:267 (-) Transcript_4666:255-1055(-)